MKNAFFRLALLGSVALTTASAQAVQLVSNGGFEEVDAQGFFGKDWKVSSVGTAFPPNFYFDNWSSVPGSPAGVSAWLGFNNDDDVTLSQSISTAGYRSARLSFDLFSDGYDATTYDFMYVRFGGQLLDTIDLGSDIAEPFSLALSYDLSPRLTGTNQLLEIQVVNDSSAETYSWVDNVSIEATPVPEPASLVALGVGALGFLRRRRVARS